VTLKTEAAGVPTMQISLTRDPLTLLVTNTTDPNGIQRGTTFDGFNRPQMSTVTPRWSVCATPRPCFPTRRKTAS
jgi:hypothetical protein